MNNISMIQEIPKHICGEYYNTSRNVTCQSKGNILIIPLYHCGECDIYEFYGKEFKDYEEANIFVEENKGGLEKLSNIK